MKKQGLKHGILKRILGIPATRTPMDSDCWQYAGGILTIDLSKTRELGKNGGAIRLEGEGLPEKVLVFRGDDGKCRAFRNRCTHIGHRRLDPVPGQNCVQCCSVLGSIFEYDGERVSGPARHPVKTFAVEQDGDTLKITLA